MKIPPFLARHGKTFLSFGSMQAMQMLLPLLALPWLARKLDPYEFGVLLYLCLIPPLAALFMDCGLGAGGAREATAMRQNPAALASLLGAALAARAMLAALACAICALAYPFLPYAEEYPAAYVMAVLAGVSRGANPTWFFQGAGLGLARMAAFDICASAAILLLTLLFIDEPHNWQLYLLFMALCRGLAYGFITHALWRRYRPHASLRGGLALLGRTMALSASAFAVIAANNGGQIMLGFYLSAADMGIIAACYKMLRALAGLINPCAQTIFPEICIWLRAKPERARIILRYSLALTAPISCLAAALAAYLAPWLIGIALGPDYAGAVSALRIMLIGLPLMACNNVLTYQTLTPYGKEKAQLSVQAACALLSLPLGAILGGFFGLIGGAFLPVCLESICMAGFVAAIWRHCPQAFWQSR